MKRKVIKSISVCQFHVNTILISVCDDKYVQKAFVVKAAKGVRRYSDNNLIAAWRPCHYCYCIGIWLPHALINKRK